jgi:hypothetical protein
MSCFVAVTAPLLATDSFNAFPAPSTVTHDVVEVQAIPFKAVVPSTFVVVQDEDSIWLVLVAICTVPTLSAIAQNEEERQNTAFIAAEPWSSSVQDVEPGLVEYRK